MYDRVDELLRATGYRGGVIGVSKTERKLQTAEEWKTQASEERRQKAAEAAKQQLFLYDAETDAD